MNGEKKRARLDQRRAPIHEALENFRQMRVVPFDVPGHKRGRGNPELTAFLGQQCVGVDVNSMKPLDNLCHPVSVIREAEELAADAFGAAHAFLMVGGTTSSVQSMVLTACKRGDEIILPRNVHRSVLNALVLCGAVPVYVNPEVDQRLGISLGMKREQVAKAIAEHPSAVAVLVNNPTYYGICSDIRAIAKVTHDRGKVLIVDQAHGAHLKFFDTYGIDGFPRAAEDLGADLVINSIHKTLASWTQSALLNVCTDRVNCHVLEDKLQMIESSSPSYPLMATLDINADLLLEKGEDLTRAWAESLTWFYEEVKKIPGLVIMETPTLDHTKLNIDLSAYGVNGNELENLLMQKGIFLELVTGNIIMCMSGIGNTRSDFERLLTALWEITAARKPVTAAKMAQPPALTTRLERRALPREKVLVPLAEAAGKVCASSLIPYPPGVPIACPGEVLTEEVLAYVKARRDADEKVIGITADGDVFVGK